MDAEADSDTKGARGIRCPLGRGPRAGAAGRRSDARGIAARGHGHSNSCAAPPCDSGRRTAEPRAASAAAAEVLTQNGNSASGRGRQTLVYEDDLVVCLLRGGFARVEQTQQSRGLGLNPLPLSMRLWASARAFRACFGPGHHDIGRAL